MMRFRKKAQNSYRADPDLKRMLAVKHGDRNAFDDLMRKYYARILNFVYRLIGDRHRQNAGNPKQFYRNVRQRRGTRNN